MRQDAMTCTHCTVPMEAVHKFCPNCGTKRPESEMSDEERQALDIDNAGAYVLDSTPMERFSCWAARLVAFARRDKAREVLGVDKLTAEAAQLRADLESARAEAAKARQTAFEELRLWANVKARQQAEANPAAADAYACCASMCREQHDREVDRATKVLESAIKPRPLPPPGYDVLAIPEPPDRRDWVAAKVSKHTRLMSGEMAFEVASRFGLFTVRDHLVTWRELTTAERVEQAAAQAAEGAK